ncbi:MAG: hypothetical protein IKA74_03475 [Clostridia bacterium]|nr:hypothetical protein [Clostridia bacterium]
MKKRILSLVLIAVMLVCMIPAMSLVSYADGGYDALPDDANKAHFLALVDAYGDEATIPTADVINAKLTNYLSSNKAMTSDDVAGRIALTLKPSYPNDTLEALTADIKAVIDPNGDGTVEGDLMSYYDALYNELYFVNGVDGDVRIMLAPLEANYIISTLLNTYIIGNYRLGAMMAYVYSDLYTAGARYTAADGNSNNLRNQLAAKFNSENVADWSVNGLTDYIFGLLNDSDTSLFVILAGSSLDVEGDDAKREAVRDVIAGRFPDGYKADDDPATEDADLDSKNVKGAFAEYLYNNGFTLAGYTGDDMLDKMTEVFCQYGTAGVDATLFAAQLYAGMSSQYAGFTAPYSFGEGAKSPSFTGLKVELKDVMTTINEQMTYGTRRVANFYLNFTDVATSGEADKFKAILDYYFAPGKGHYGYYEDLWYDDGNLIAYIDASTLDQAYYTTKRVTLDEDGTTVVDLVPSHFAKYVDVYDILSVNSDINSASGMGTYHSALKILGGQNIGQYNLVGSFYKSGDTDTATSGISITEDGYLKTYTTDNQANTSLGAGIYTGNLFTYDMIKDRDGVQAHFNNLQTMGNIDLWLDDNLSTTADANGSYGYFTLQTNYKYSDFWQNNVAATGSNYNANFALGVFGDLSGQAQMGFTTFNARIYYKDNRACTNFVGMDSNSTNPMLTLSKYYYFDEPHTFNLTLEGRILDPVVRKFELKFDILGEKDVDYSKHYGSAAYQSSILPAVNNRARGLSYHTRNTGYIATVDKYIDNIRMYSVELTDAQKARNYFADLIYKYAVDVSAYDIEMILEYADDTFYNGFSEYNMYDTTDATKTAMKEKIDAFVSELDFIVNYRELYVERENLYAEVDFTAINENTVGYYNSSTTTVPDNIRYIEPEIGAFASQSSYQYFELTNNGGRHAYVRISDGTAKGNWFVLTASNTSNKTTAEAATDTLLPYTPTPSLLYGTTYGNVYTDEQRQSEDYIHPFLEYAEDGSVSFKAGVSNNYMVYTGFRWTDAQIKNAVNPGAGQPCYQWRSTRNTATNTGLGSANSADTCNINGTGYTAQYIFYAPGSIPGTYSNFMNVSMNNVGLNIGLSGSNRVFGTRQNVIYKTLKSSDYPYIGINFVGTFDAIVDDVNPYTTDIISYVNAELLVDERESSATYNEPLKIENLGQGGGWDGAAFYYYRTTPTYLRIYITDLTAEEIAINNFVDICRFYGVSTEAYRNAGIAQQKLIVNEFKGSQIGSVGCDSKEAVEAKLAGVLGNADSIFSFIGFQARVSKNVGIRSVYAYDTTKAESFRKATVVAYGALVGYDSFENLTVTFDGTAIDADGKNFVADIIADEDDGFKSFEEAERLSVLPDSEDTTTVFAYTVDFINGSIDRNGNVTGDDYTNRIPNGGTVVAKEQLMFFRGFVIIELDGEYLYLYDDGISQNYQANGGAVSLVDICTYYKTEYPQYVNNAAINHPLKDEE